MHMHRYRDLWRTISLCLLLATPAVLCQDVFPLISREFWQSRSEWFYPLLMPSKSLRTRTDGAITILEIDKETEREFGWPLPRHYYVETLDRLKQHGHPWVLSFLLFQSKKAAEGEKGAAEDEALSKAISRYGRFVGSGISVQKEADLSAEQRLSILPKALLSSPSTEMPAGIPLALEEDEMFMKAEAQYGLAPRYGTEAVINCTRHYLSDVVEGGQLVLPTSMLWATALHGALNIRTAQGQEKMWRQNRPYLHVADRHCLSEPRMDTRQLLAARGIAVLPLREYLAKPSQYPMAGKLVILASAKMRLFQGPGAINGVAGSGIVPEHLLNARFLSDLVEGLAVARNDGFGEDSLRQGLLAGTGLLMLMSLFTGPAFLLTLSAASLVALLGVSYFYLNILQSYFIPLATVAAVSMQCLGLLGFWLYTSYRHAMRRFQFITLLRRELSKVSDFDGLVVVVEDVLKTQLILPKVAFTSLNAAFYEAVKRPESHAELLGSALNLNSETVGVQRKGAEMSAYQGVGGFLGRRRQAVVQCQIATEAEGLGTFQGQFQFYRWEKGLVQSLIALFRQELGVHWRRIDLVTLQRLKDYQATVNGTRTQILEKFLTRHIVAKFSHQQTMEENLQKVLTPHRAKAAIMQADIRGYSSFFIDRDPLEVIHLLKGYYGGVVDAASHIAQVKLIGDCIFLFIEDQGLVKGKSAVDAAVELAVLLVQETLHRNHQRKRSDDKAVVFGVAIHYGDVILGNLSSDNCIDYTVVGPHVNRTARMEELTKHESVKAVLGENGILLSDEACAALHDYAKLPWETLDLQAIGARIRSFDSIMQLRYLRAEQVLSPNASHEAAA